MLEFLRNKRVLIVVAHPDDELLGAGASMHRMIKDHGVITKVVILGEGLTSRSNERNLLQWETDLKVHKGNIERVRLIIGYHEVAVYDLPDNRFDSVDLLDIIKIIEKEKSAFKPDVIFTHHGGDLNVDHRRTFEAVMTATRPMESENANLVFSFETPSGTEWRPSTDQFHFIPNFFIKVSKEDVDKKIEGMEAYEFEKRTYPHPRSPQALTVLASRWGVACGVEFAEAFCIVRGIMK